MLNPLNIFIKPLEDEYDPFNGFENDSAPSDRGDDSKIAKERPDGKPAA